jgi:uncharacterized metal-binding protein
MADCCGGKDSGKAEAACCGAGKTKMVLLYACSGGANVAEIADRAARQLTREGCGTMFCLAGLGADIAAMVQTARDADLNLLLDGCPMDCAKKTFDRHGVRNYIQIKVTDLGIEKAKGVPVKVEQVDKTVSEARRVLTEALKSK